MQKEPQVNELGFALFILEDEYRNLCRQAANPGDESSKAHWEVVDALAGMQVLQRAILRIEPTMAFALQECFAQGGLDKPLVGEVV